MARRLDPRAPRIEPLLLRGLVESGRAPLVAEARIEGKRFDGVDLTEADLAGIVLDGCEPVDATLTDAVLDAARLVETIVEHAAATSVRAVRSTLRDVRIEGCRFGAAEWFDAEWDRGEVGSTPSICAAPTSTGSTAWRDCAARSSRTRNSPAWRRCSPRRSAGRSPEPRRGAREQRRRVYRY